MKIYNPKNVVVTIDDRPIDLLSTPFPTWENGANPDPIGDIKRMHKTRKQKAMVT